MPFAISNNIMQPATTDVKITMTCSLLKCAEIGEIGEIQDTWERNGRNWGGGAGRSKEKPSHVAMQ